MSWEVRNYIFDKTMDNLRFNVVVIIKNEDQFIWQINEIFQENRNEFAVWWQPRCTEKRLIIGTRFRVNRLYGCDDLWQKNELIIFRFIQCEPSSRGIRVFNPLPKQCGFTCSSRSTNKHQLPIFSAVDCSEQSRSINETASKLWYEQFCLDDGELISA